MTDEFLFALVFGSLIAGIYLERGRAFWAKRRWLAKRGITAKAASAKFQNPHGSPITDPAEQLRAVIGADFEKRAILSKAEARVLYAAETAVKEANLSWRVMAQVSLGQVLSSPDARAYAEINCKRVDLLIVSRQGIPITAIEYQGEGHYQGSAAARDAVKKEALRKAGVRYIEVTPEHSPDELASEISRIAKLEQASAIQVQD